MTITGPQRALYVTDLDGTLLDAEGVVPVESHATLARLLAQGTGFTVATARSPRSAMRALGGLPLSMPLIAYNGATAAGPGDDSALWWHHFDPRVLHPLIGASLAAGVAPLVFWLGPDGADRISWVSGTETTGIDAFLEARPGDPRLTPVDGWDEIDHESGFFVSIVGEYPAVRRLARMIRAISWGAGCSLALQQERDGSGLAMLDITPVQATKGSAVRRVAAEHGFTRVIAFGDAASDLTMFAEADESYAVAGASSAVKEAATAVLDPHPDAVVRFLADHAASRAEV